MCFFILVEIKKLLYYNKNHMEGFKVEDNVKRINLEQLMAGALLKFDKVDALDRTLLVQDFF